MFKNLTIISILAAIVFFVMWLFSEFSEAAYLSNAISYVFIAALCGKLYSMEGDINTLKSHLGIKNGEQVNNIPDNPEQCVDYDEDFSEYEWVKVTDSNCKDSYNNVYDDKKDE